MQVPGEQRQGQSQRHRELLRVGASNQGLPCTACAQGGDRGEEGDKEEALCIGVTVHTSGGCSSQIILLPFSTAQIGLELLM